jgi:hypothetical protein
MRKVWNEQDCLPKLCLLIMFLNQRETHNKENKKAQKNS